MRSAGDFLRYLEQAHPDEVLRIPQPIDPKNGEHAAFEEYLAQRGRYPWLIFEHVKTVAGELWPGFFSNYCGNKAHHLALAYGLDVDQTRVHDLVVTHLDATTRPEPPEYVPRERAPVKAVVRSGDGARLDQLPFFRNCEHDSGVGWFTPVWIIRELESRRFNVSWHRGQYLDSTHSTVWFYPGGHMYDIFHDHRRAGRRLPAVAVIGHHPAFENAGGVGFGRDVDELEGVAGIYRRATGTALRVTASETWGDELLVPADAEVIVEGYVLDQYEEAGPWGDYWLVYAPRVRMNVFEVTAITRRVQPIFSSVWPATEADFNIQGAAAVLAALKQHYPTVKTVHYPFAQTAIVAFEPRMPGEALHLAASLMHFGMGLKLILVVDDDVDPTDPAQVFFALTTRVDALRDVHALPMIRHVCNPIGEGATVGGLLIDATKPRGNPAFEVAKPPKLLVDQVSQYLPEEVLAKLAVGPRHSW